MSSRRVVGLDAKKGQTEKRARTGRDPKEAQNKAVSAGWNVGTVFSLFAALLVYELGKQAGLWALLAVRDRLGDALSGGSQAVWFGLGGIAMQLGGGAICGIVWRKWIAWQMPRRWKSRNTEGGGKKRTDAFSTAASFLGLAVSSALGLNLLLGLIRLPDVSQAFQKTAAAQAAVPLWLGLLLYGLIAPFSEEILFRGILYGRARKTLGRNAAVFFSGILFAVYHGNVVQGIYALSMGILLACIYEKAGSIWAAVIFHGVGNVAVFLAIDRLGLGNVSLLLRIFACVALLAAAAGCVLEYFPQLRLWFKAKA